LAARRLDRLEQVAVEVRDLGGDPLVVQADVCKADDIQRIVQAALDRWGRIDVLINNAGIGHDKLLLRTKPERIRAEVQVNLVAAIECSLAVLPVMIRQKSGHIINVASLAGLVGLPGSTVYSATKFGLIGFSDALRRELQGSGIHVSAYCPGFTPTELNPQLKARLDAPAGPRPPGMMPVTYVADWIARLVRHPRRRLIVPVSWRLPLLAACLLPGMVDKVMPVLLKIKEKRYR
jgi:short-subunit dehydrogenase